MYNDQLIYKVVIWAFLGISLWTNQYGLSSAMFDLKLQKIAMLCASIYQTLNSSFVWHSAG